MLTPRVIHPTPRIIAHYIGNLAQGFLNVHVPKNQQGVL